MQAPTAQCAGSLRPPRGPPPSLRPPVGRPPEARRKRGVIPRASAPAPRPYRGEVQYAPSESATHPAQSSPFQALDSCCGVVVRGRSNPPSYAHKRAGEGGSARSTSGRDVLGLFWPNRGDARTKRVARTDAVGRAERPNRRPAQRRNGRPVSNGRQFATDLASDGCPLSGMRMGAGWVGFGRDRGGRRSLNANFRRRAGAIGSKEGVFFRVSVLFSTLNRGDVQDKLLESTAPPQESAAPQS